MKPVIVSRVAFSLAGEKGVQLFESFMRRGLIRFDGGNPVLTKKGRTAMIGFGIDMGALEKLRRPLCRCCLDWSERRSHLAGSVGQALLERMLNMGWVGRDKGSRVVTFSSRGGREFAAFLSV